MPAVPLYSGTAVDGVGREVPLYESSSGSRFLAGLPFPDLVPELGAMAGFFPDRASFSLACASIARFFRSILLSFSLGTA